MEKKSIRFNKKYSGFLLLILCLISIETFATRFADVSKLITTVSGTVKDNKGIPLTGVSIKVKDKNIGTITGTNGEFTLNVPDGNDIILVSFIGYVSQEIALNGRTSLNITLIEDVSKLNEVVVVGYGSQSRDKMSTSISKLDVRALQNTPHTNAGAALKGAISGLQVQTNSAQPGAAPRILLRGGTSINNPNGATPLYIVDGVVRQSGLNDINPSAIESIQVLKDAASTAIYGAKGSNGVIIVTTKTGRSNKVQINYHFDGSVANATRLLEYAGAQDYIYYSRLGLQAAGVYNASLLTRLSGSYGYGTGNNLTNATAFTTQYLSSTNQNKLTQGWQSMPDPINPSQTIIFNETNFQNLLYRNGITNNHYIDASGGTDKSTFYAALGYMDAKGVAIETDYRRLTFNMNGSYQVLNNLNIFGKIQYTNSNSHVAPNLANVFYRSASLPGTAKYQFEDGTIAPGQNSSIGNPDYYFTGRYALQAKQGVETTGLALGGKWNIIKDLVFEPTLSLYRENTPSSSFQPAALLNGVGTVVTTRTANAAIGGTTQYMAEGVFTYAHTFGSKNNFEVKGGFSHFHRQNTVLSAQGQNAATDLINTLNGSATPTLVNSTISNQAIQGLFSRVNYDYDGKYLLTMNLRYDGASNLGENKKFGLFPGVSAGWNIDREAFWAKMVRPDLMQLKLRASYGVNGNISGLSDFQPLGSYISALYGGQAAIVIQPTNGLPNENLQWEQSKTFDVGADIGLFNRKVAIILDYYNRTTSNLLTTVSLPASTGYNSVFTNFGTLKNVGYEGEINVDVLPSKSAFKWTTSINAAHTSREITKLPFNGQPNNRQGGILIWNPALGTYAYAGGLQEGGRMGDMFSYKQVGIYPTDAAGANALPDMIPAAANRKKYGGDVIWQDTDGNGLIDSRDQVYMGNPYPVWTGGFNNYFTYKAWGLSIRTDFATGNTIFNYPALIANSQAQGDALPLKSYINSMWKNQGDITNTPRYTWQDQPSNIFRGGVGNDTYYEKGDFWALREVSLSYTLPESMARKIKLGGVRINATGNNLYYLTKFTGLNPEDGGQDNGHYPISRTFTLGVNVTF